MVRLTKHSLRTLECKANLLILWGNIRLVGTKIHDLWHVFEGWMIYITHDLWWAMVVGWFHPYHPPQKPTASWCPASISEKKHPVGSLLSKGKNRWNLWHWGHRGNLHIFPPPRWTLRGFQPLKKWLGLGRRFSGFLLGWRQAVFKTSNSGTSTKRQS